MGLGGERGKGSGCWSDIVDGVVEEVSRIFLGGCGAEEMILSW